ncbi:MAG: hypothetical protein ACI837_000144 [Crocinitomicaceae bacterium]|jgi:hypothetical protein
MRVLETMVQRLLLKDHENRYLYIAPACQDIIGSGLFTSFSFTDPISQADQAASASATVDIFDATGPSPGSGWIGIPHSGTRFCSGLHAASGTGLLWHEVISQVVSGVTVSNNYAISLCQSVVKQGNCLDQSGSWRIYLDGILLATTAVSTSTLAMNDPSLVWDNRVVNFTATSASHTIKFNPWDDDAGSSSSRID